MHEVFNLDVHNLELSHTSEPKQVEYFIKSKHLRLCLISQISIVRGLLFPIKYLKLVRQKQIGKHEVFIISEYLMMTRFHGAIKFHISFLYKVALSVIIIGNYHVVLKLELSWEVFNDSLLYFDFTILSFLRKLQKVIVVSSSL